MQVQLLNLMPNFTLNNKHSMPLKSNNVIIRNNLTNDVFVKNNIAFKGASDDKIGIAEAMATIGVVGAPLLLSIAGATYLAKHQQPKELFTYDGMYIGNVDDFKVETDKVMADADDGIFKVKGTGINIDASKYDIADTERGIYRNWDGSVDIDLLHNKYIDKVNGIFVDPDAKISAVKVGNELVNINLPAFGSGYPTCPWDPRWNDSYLIGSSDQYRHEDINLTRSEYKSLFGYEPENDPHGIQAKGDILPDRSLSEKLNDFFSGKSDEKYDIFGRRFFEFKDTEGHLQKIALDDESYAIVKELKIDGDAIPALAKLIDNLKLEQYISHNYPDLNYLAIPKFNSVEEFMQSLHHIADSDAVGEVIETVDSDNIPEVDDTHNFFHDLVDLIKEKLGE